MKIFIIYLLFIRQVFGQAGGIQVQEAGVTNYQIQPTVPTTVPVAGKKYLFNDNGIFSTKDSASNIQRINNNQFNILTNGDIEQGLSGYAGIGTLNTATPLFGLNSLALDTTAINDMAETLPFLMKPGFNGQNCMGQFTISPTDGNLSASVINADGTTVVTQVIAASTNNQTVHLTFGCPPGTATVNQRTLKVRVFQSGANAAAVNLDSFYLGLFSADRISVVEQGQWYYYTVNADINGNFSFPAPTASTNDKTLFTYAGTTLTALKTIKLDISLLARTAVSANAIPNTTTTCTVNGTPRVIADNHPEAGASTIWGITSFGTINLSPGDTCNISTTRTNTTYSSHTVNITATPLPSLASLVASPNLPAGWLGQRTWSLATCQWSKSTTPMGPFAAVAACAGPINSGFVTNDAVTNGQLPKVTLSKLPKGKITVNLSGLYYFSTGTNNTNFFSLAINGVVLTNNVQGFSAAQPGTGVPFLSFTFDNPNELTNATIELYHSATMASPLVIFGNNTASTPPLNIVVSYEPDLSSPYNQSIIAALAPQISNSTEKRYRYENCLILNPAGTASLGSSPCTNWVQSASRIAAGKVTVNFIPGVFPSPPICVAIGGRNDGGGAVVPINFVTFPTTTSLTTQSSTVTAISEDNSFELSCGGFY